MPIHLVVRECRSGKVGHVAVVVVDDRRTLVGRRFRAGHCVSDLGQPVVRPIAISCLDDVAVLPCRAIRVPAGVVFTCRCRDVGNLADTWNNLVIAESRPNRPARTRSQVSRAARTVRPRVAAHDRSRPRASELVHPGDPAVVLAVATTRAANPTHQSARHRAAPNSPTPTSFPPSSMPTRWATRSPASGQSLQPPRAPSLRPSISAASRPRFQCAAPLACPCPLSCRSIANRYAEPRNQPHALTQAAMCVPQPVGRRCVGLAATLTVIGSLPLFVSAAVLANSVLSTAARLGRLNRSAVRRPAAVHVEFRTMPVVGARRRHGSSDRRSVHARGARGKRGFGRWLSPSDVGAAAVTVAVASAADSRAHLRRSGDVKTSGSDRFG